MKLRVLALVLLIGTGGMTSAQETGAVSEPMLKASLAVSDTEDVRREKHHNPGGFAGAHLRTAQIADVDLNGDGHISFDELLRFDVTKDF